MKDRGPKFVAGILLLIAAAAVLGWWILGGIFGVFGAQAAAPLPPDVTLDPTTWFGSTAALAGVTALVVQFVKPHLNISGILVKVLAIAVGALAGLVGGLAGLVSGGALAGLWFGAGAGVLAAGGKDFLRSVLSSGGSTPPPSDTGSLPR